MIATKSWSIQNYHWSSTIHRRRHGTIILGHKQLKQCNWKLFLRLFQELTMYRWSGERDLSAIVHLKLLARMFFPLSTHYQIRLPYHITDKHEKLDTWTDAILQWIYRSVIPASTWSATTNGEPSPRTAKHMPGYPFCPQATGNRQTSTGQEHGSDRRVR